MWSGVYPVMTNSTPVVVCDAGPLIHLDELGCLNLLNDFSQVLIPEQVWQEVERLRPKALNQPSFVAQRIAVDLSEEAAFQALVQTLALNLGEQAALSLMRAYPEAIFLTDDASARLAAVTLGYRVHGSIGILLRAIRRQQLTRDEVLKILQNLPVQSTLYIKASLLQEIITKLKNTS